ncbi:unnamed protein product, partial [Didymodactylos carnosus]
GRVRGKRGKINLEKAINKNLFDMTTIPEREEQQSQQQTASTSSNVVVNPKEKFTAEFKRAITMMKQRSEPNESLPTDAMITPTIPGSNNNSIKRVLSSKLSQSPDSSLLDKLACLTEKKLTVLPHDTSLSTNITTVDPLSSTAPIKLASASPQTLNDYQQNSPSSTQSIPNSKFHTDSASTTDNNHHQSLSSVKQESSDSHLSLSIINPPTTSSMQHLAPSTTNHPILHYEPATTTTILNMDLTSSSKSDHSSGHICPSTHTPKDSSLSSFTPITVPHPTTTLSSQPLVKQSLQQIHSSIMQLQPPSLSPSPQSQQQSTPSPSTQLSAGYIRLLNGGRAPIASPDPLSLTDDSVCANTPEIDIL